MLRHDVGVEPPPAGRFDLVHARLLLTHVPGRIEGACLDGASAATGRLAGHRGRRPGVAAADLPGRVRSRAAAGEPVAQGFRTLMADRGAELAFGRTLPRLLREAGLDAVQADAFFPITSPACTALETATVRQIRERLVAAGLATDADIEQHLQRRRRAS